MSICISPAYGRDYKSKKEVLAAFQDNKDFVVESIMSPHCGRYCNRADLIKGGESKVEIRYARKSKVTIVKL